MKRTLSLVAPFLVALSIQFPGLAGDVKQAESQIIVKSSYALDVCHFLNTLTGDSRFASYHQKDYKEWSPKLSPTAKGVIAAIAKQAGTNGISPFISSALTFDPDFEAKGLMNILLNPTYVIEKSYSELPPGTASQPKEVAYRLAGGLSMVVGELEAKGFKGYWEKNWKALVDKRMTSYGSYLDSMKIDLGKELSDTLGPIPHRTTGPITLYLLAFSEPYGTRLYGRSYSVPISWDNIIITRTALHEMLHQSPYQENYGPAFQRLVEDPFIKECFAKHLARKNGDYPTPAAFLEENITEALETAISARVGLCKTPIGYLKAHDEGTHWLSIVMIRYLKAIPKDPAETLGNYLIRVVEAMPLGKLDTVYKEQLKVKE